jgi:hypothetical protein
MSSIDAYKYKLLGMVRCPSSFELVYASERDKKQDQWIPLYKLLEDIPQSESDFQGKKVDLILGGGGGEIDSLRIKMPEAIAFWTKHSSAKDKKFISVFGFNESLVKAFWSMNMAFYLCEGFKKIGWDGKLPIEIWIMENIIAFIIKEYKDGYKDFIGPDLKMPDSVSNIIRLPNSDELGA